jgi:hypothetical protein
VVSGQEDGTLRNAVKTKTPIKKRRYGRTMKHFSKSDVQCNAKNYDGATVSPKPKNANNKKHQRNHYGKSFTYFQFLSCSLIVILYYQQLRRKTKQIMLEPT